MKKLLYTYERDMPTVNIMYDSAMTQATDNDMEIRFKQILEVSKADILWCDVVVLIRPNDPYSVHLARCAQKSGCFVIAFFDDDLYELPSSMPNPIWRKNSILKVMAYSNTVGSSSPHISNKYRNYTLEKRCYTADTMVDPSEIKFITEEPQEEYLVKLVYAANAGHVAFFNQFIMPAMPRLCERYAGRISMTFFGVRPDLSKFESSIDICYHSSMPLEEYRRMIKEGDYDIGLSPLTTTEFTKCKYFNKFIEYTMAGIVGVYSKTEPYTYVVEHGINGLLAADDIEEWYRVLCQAIDDSALRNRCIKNAQQLLLNEFNYEKVQEKEEKQVPERYCHSSPHYDCGSLTIAKPYYYLIRMLDRAFLALFYLRRTGISGFVTKTKIHFRERKAYQRKAYQ